MVEALLLSGQTYFPGSRQICLVEGSHNDGPVCSLYLCHRGYCFLWAHCIVQGWLKTASGWQLLVESSCASSWLVYPVYCLLPFLPFPYSTHTVSAVLEGRSGEGSEESCLPLLHNCCFLLHVCTKMDTFRKLFPIFSVRFMGKSLQEGMDFPSLPCTQRLLSLLGAYTWPSPILQLLYLNYSDCVSLIRECLCLSPCKNLSLFKFWARFLPCDISSLMSFFLKSCIWT